MYIFVFVTLQKQYKSYIFINAMCLKYSNLLNKMIHNPICNIFYEGLSLNLYHILYNMKSR